MSDQELDVVSFKAIGLSDASLVGISWVNDGRDILLILTHARGQEVQLSCDWVHALEMSLKFPSQHGAPPFLWDASLTPTANGHLVELDFASQGSLRFECQSVVHVGRA